MRTLPFITLFLSFGLCASALAEEKTCTRSFMDYIRGTDNPACKDDPSVKAAVKSEASESGAETSDKPSDAASGQVIAGIVIETMNAAGYTYAQIDTRAQKLWLATSERPLKKGDIVQFMENDPFEDFKSKTLNRTFKSIYFINELAVNGALTIGEKGAKAALAGSGPSAPSTSSAAATSAMASSSMAEQAPVKPADTSKTEKLANIASLMTRQKELASQNVSVSGTVTKINNGIMGRNWVHLVDASLKDKTKDLMFTTQDSFAVGQKVTVRGTVALNKDFGSGYFYAVMLENAEKL